jgi:hypothetical protein
MDKQQLLNYLEKLDAALDHPAMLYIYGSAVCILLDEPDRTSLDIDVAGPYSDADYGAIVRAAERVGIPVNPAGDTPTDHIEWIQALRLCLPAPSPERSMLLWQGAQLTVKSGSPADLIASKLIRYDEVDQGDMQFLFSQTRISFDDVADAVKRLPPPFNDDCMVLENLKNYRMDTELWKGGRT